MYYTRHLEAFDLDLLDDEWPFEIDGQASHLFKHPYLSTAEVSGQVLVVPLAPSRSGEPSRCRPIGCYVAADHLARRYKEDR
jgi:hypothetical protein